MKTFVSFKTLFVTLTMAFAFVASAEIRENTFELTQVRSVDAATSELSFNRSFVNEDGKDVKQTLKVTDDDGLLSIAAINFSMMQKISETVFRKAQTESYAAAREEWERIKNFGLKRFSNVKPALLASLSKLASYSSNEIRKMKAQIRVAEQNRDFAAVSELNAKIAKAEYENAKALEAHKEIDRRESISPKEFSDIVGKLLNELGVNHVYATSINGAPAVPLALLDSNPSNPLGAFFASRPLYMSDDVMSMNESRGALEFAANVLQEIETSNKVFEGEGAHRRELSLDDDLVQEPR